MAGNLGNWAGAGDERRGNSGVDKQVCFEWRAEARGLREGVKNGHGHRWGGAHGDMKHGGTPLDDPFTCNNFVAQQNQ